MTGRELKFKNDFIHNDGKRVNKFDIYHSQVGIFKIKVDNGKYADSGKEKLCYFNLSKEQAKELMLYLQEKLNETQTPSS